MSGGPGDALGGQAGRGVVLIVVAVIIGALLLWNGTEREGGLVEAADDDATATTEPDDPSTDTTVPPSTVPTTDTTLPTTTTPPAELGVVVANAAGGVPGLAGSTGSILEGAGFAAPRLENANAVDSSVVYFVAGAEGDAQAVASALQLPPESVQPLPEPPPLALEEGESVLVLVGPERANTAPAG